MTEPVSLNEAKAQMRLSLSETGEDSLITGLIVAARAACEKEIGRAISARSMTKVIDAFPAAPRDMSLQNARDRRMLDIPLGGGIVSAVTAVQYYDGDGTDTTLAVNSYDTDLVRMPARLSPVDQWPVAGDRAGAVRISYSLAAMDGDDLAIAKQAILLLVATWFGTRETDSTDTVREVPYGITWLLRPLIQMARS